MGVDIAEVFFIIGASEFLASFQLKSHCRHPAFPTMAISVSLHVTNDHRDIV
jgi:hypothetical protein